MRKLLYILLLFLFVSTISFSQEKINEYMLVTSKIYYKKYEDAEIILNKLIAENNRDAKFYLTLGDLYFKEKKYEDAKNQFVLAMKNKNNFAIYKIAECYSKMGNASEAIEYLKLYLKTNNKLLQSEIKLNPNFQNIENSKEWVSLWKAKHYNNYEKKLDEAKYLISKEDYTNAFDLLDKLIIQNKRHHKAYEMRGDLLMQKDEYKSAAKSYKKASEIKVHNSNYKEKLAIAYFKDKNFKKSLKFCNEAIKENQYNKNTYLLKAKNLLALEKYNKAKSITDFIFKYYPDDNEALNVAGLCLYNKKQYIKALEKYNQLLSEDKEDLKAKNIKPNFYINRADAYMAVSMYENVISDLSMALDLNPKLQDVYYKRGLAKLKANKKVEACYDFKFAYNLGYYKASDMLIKHCR